MKKGSLLFSVTLALGCLVSCGSKTTSHKVIFINYDKTVLQESTVEDNTYAQYTGATPTRPKDQYEYYFTDFYPKPSETPVLFDTTFTAIFAPITNKIVWLNWNGEVLEIDFNVEEGTMPTYDGEEPYKEGAEFIGWAPEITPVTGSAEYVAMFNDPTSEYKLDIKCNDDDLGSTTGSGIYHGGEIVTIEAISKKDGYALEGWYLDDKFQTKVYDQNPATFPMPNQDTTVYAKFDIAKYQINYVLNGGINNEDNPETYTMFETSDIVFKDPTKEGYVFKGWFDESGNQVIKIPMGSKGNVTIEAKWEANQHKVITHCDSTCGSTKGDGSYGYEEDVEVIVYPKNGYKFEGWYDNEAFEGNPVSTKEHYSFVMPDNDVELYAKCSIITYTITYDYAGGTEVENKTSYTVEDETFTFNNPTKAHYTFTGWLNSETKKIITSVPKGSYGDLKLVAQWEINKYNVILNNKFEQWGTVDGAGTYDYGAKVEITATPGENRKFIGWYDNEAFEGEPISTNEKYSFEMPDNDVELYALFEEHDDNWKREHGAIPCKQDEYIITYGMYPQTVVTDKTLINSLKKQTVESETGYIYFEDEYYAKLIASPCADDYYFSDGETKVTAGEEYFFKCEKLQWYFKISKVGEYTLDSAYILSKETFDSTTNVYRNSSLRTYLNNTFTNKAFMLNKDYLLTKTLWSGEAENAYIAYHDVYIEQYDGEPYKPVTDYALAQGVEMTEYKDYRCGAYWTRSPSDNEEKKDYVYAINYNGNEVLVAPNATNVGVSPAIQLKIFE